MKRFLYILLLLFSVSSLSARRKPETVSQFVAEHIVYYVRASAAQPEVEVRAALPEMTPYAGSLVIPDSVSYREKRYAVVAVGDTAFRNCTSLVSVTLPATLHSVGAYAFAGCTSLQTVKMPPAMRIIQLGAFENCTSLSSLILPEGLRVLNFRTFYHCSSLREVRFPDSLRQIGASCFSACGSLQTLTLPEGLLSIGRMLSLIAKTSPLCASRKDSAA